MAVRTPAYVKYLNALVLIGFGWLAVLIELTPLNERAATFPAPDLLFCICAFLVIRRPSATPGFLVVLLALARDLISGGPVGLGAITLLAAIEVLRAGGDLLRRRALIFEFGAVAALTFVMIAVQVFALLITLSNTPPLDQLVLRALGTIAAYVGIYILMRWVLRVRGEQVDDRRLTKKAA